VKYAGRKTKEQIRTGTPPRNAKAAARPEKRQYLPSKRYDP